MKRPNRISAFRSGGNLCALLTAVVLVLGFSACGRTPSRLLGKSARQVLHVEGMKPDGFIDISFDRRGSSTVKDVTFHAEDGYIYTVEFRDVNPLEGTIRWVPHTEGDSLIQSRGLSRLFGTAVELKLPADCKEVLGVDVTFADKDERVKNLTYRTQDGRILSKEYREGFVDRHMEGWVEIRGK